MKQVAQFAILFCLMLTASGCRSVSESETVSGEALDAPPEVTAKAWAIADGRTGEFLWGDHADDPRKTASTTKMMCTYVVLKLAEKNPAILDERVTFTELAGTTTGSTAAVKPGESATVRDLLYGLMLPSGNDAGNALAEHFHPRCAPPDEVMRDFGLGNPLLKTRANFIAEMNRTALSLGLSNTVYRSSFGDGGTEDDRTTTARDLTRVAWHAMQVPAFRAIVGTPRYEGKVWTTNGTPRVAVWENTNLLLGLGLGYDGVKTGTTTQAGSCLVASGQRQGEALIVVVLGSESDMGRYVDARNLFRWAWRQRGQR